MDYRRFRVRPAATVARIAPAVVLLSLAPFANAQNQIFDQRTLAPYVPTPELVVEEMLSAAEVQESDIVYDIGSGDGRILFAAAEKYGAKAVGIEINELLADATRIRAEELELDELVSVIQEDVFEADLSEATVVTVYLLSSSNTKLKPKLESELAEGSRVVSHDFQFRGWKAEKTVNVQGDTGRMHRVYVYRMGSHLPAE